MPGPPLKNAYRPNAQMITGSGAVGNRPSTTRPTAIKNSERISSGRRPMEFSQNMAGSEPTRKNRLSTLSPRIAPLPTPRPNAVMICGPNV